jgi:hypothetical protein
VNEDEHGITPADVTAISLDRNGDLWRVVIEQGNGDVVKTLELTETERLWLALMLGNQQGTVAVDHCSFVDPFRSTAGAARG